MGWGEIMNKDFERMHAHRTSTTGGATRMQVRTSRSTEKTGSPDAFEEILDCKISLQGNSGVGHTDTGRLTEKRVSGTGGATQTFGASRSTEKTGSPEAFRV